MFYSKWGTGDPLLNVILLFSDTPCFDIFPSMLHISDIVVNFKSVICKQVVFKKFDQIGSCILFQRSYYQ